MRIDNKKKIEKMRQILTEERMSFLRYIKNKNPCSLKEMAHKMKKDYGNLHRSMKILEKAKLIKLKTDGRSKIPQLRVDYIKLIFEI